MAAAILLGILSLFRTSVRLLDPGIIRTNVRFYDRTRPYVIPHKWEKNFHNFQKVLNAINREDFLCNFQTVLIRHNAHARELR